MANKLDFDKKEYQKMLNSVVSSNKKKTLPKIDASQKKLDNKKAQTIKKETVSEKKSTASYTKKSGGTSVKKQTVSEKKTLPKTTSAKRNSSGAGNTGANRLTPNQQRIQAQALMADNLPTAIQRGVIGASSGFVNSTVGLPAAILTGERLAAPSDALREAGLDQTKAYQRGNVAGELVGYTALGGLTNAALGRAVPAVLSKTKLGQMAIGGSASPAGQVAQSLSRGQRALRNLADTATVGTLQNAAIARAEGLEGEEFWKDFAANQALDLAFGMGVDAVGDVVKAIGKTDAVQNAKRASERNRNAKIFANMGENIPASGKGKETLKTAGKVAVNSPQEPTEGLSGDIKKGSTVTGQSVGNVPHRPTSETLDTSASKNTLPRNEATVNPLPSGRTLKPGGADVAREADTIENFRAKYGTFEGSDIPKATDMGDVQQGARTIRNSDILDDEAAKALEEGVRQGDYWKTTVTNKSVLDKAKAEIGDSIENATASFQSIMTEGRQARSEDIAKGYLLADEYIKQKNYDMAESILADVSAMESEAGRTLQAMRIFSKLSPAGRVKGAKRTVENLKVGRGVDIKVNQKLLDDIASATTDAEIAAANKAFAVDIWNQVPATLSEKLNAWRYLAMLGNPKTHIRNVLGNAIGIPARAMSNALATGMEKAFKGRIQKLSGGEVSGSKAIFSGKYKKLADEAYRKNKAAMEAVTSKFNENQRPSEARVYKFKPLDALRKGNSKALEFEDNMFKKGVFKKSFAQYCKANGLDLAGDISDEFMEAATNYAHAQALKATYQDPNMLADAIGKFKRKFNPKQNDTKMMAFGKTAGHQVVESTLPFVKTPANILKRGLEYSPAGVLGGIGKIATAKTAEDLMKGIEYFAQGITGSGLIGLGFYFGHRGLVNGSLGEYDRKYAYDQMLGEQGYAVNVGDYTYTIDWMSPLAMPFFVGVEAANLYDGTDDVDLWKTIESFGSLTEPVFEMSMLSGLENTFDITFSSDSKVKAILQNSMQGYVSQFVPTLSGQIARTLTPERKINMSTAETKTERGFDKYLDKLENKIPGVTEWNEPYIDQWGRTDSKKSNGDYWLAAAENLVSPGYISKRNLTPIDVEVSRLYEKLGETDGMDVIPSVSSTAYKQQFSGTEYYMTEKEFTQYKKTVGKASYSGLKKLFDSKDYKEASTDDKRKMVKKVYEAAREKGKEEFLVGSGKVTQTDYDFTKLSDKRQENYNSKIISKEKYIEYFQNAETNGKSGINQDEAKAQFAKMNLSRKEKAYLWEMTNARWINPYK